MRVSVADCIQNVHARVSRNFITKKKTMQFYYSDRELARKLTCLY